MTLRITGANITDTSVVAADLSTDSVTNPKIQNGAITISKLNSSVTLQILASDGTTVLKTIVSPGA